MQGIVICIQNSLKWCCKPLIQGLTLSKHTEMSQSHGFLGKHCTSKRSKATALHWELVFRIKLIINTTTIRKNSTRRRKVVFNMAATKLGYFTRICWPWQFGVSHWSSDRGSHSHWFNSRLWTKHRHAPVNIRMIQILFRFVDILCIRLLKQYAIKHC